MTRFVYLAVPIDLSDGVDHGQFLDTELTGRGHVVYRPRLAFGVSSWAEPHPGVERVNRSALEAADVLVAVVPRGVPSIGVPREIEAFSQWGRPWAVQTDHDGSYSLLDAPLRVSMDRDGTTDVGDWVDLQPAFADRATGRLLFAKDGHYDGQLPTRAYPGDAGFDLYAACDMHIPYDAFVDVPCGVRVALPEGTWGRIVGRSSTLRNRSLLVNEGIIDNGWRGPLFAGVRNIGPKSTDVTKGDRIAQLILMPNLAPSFRVDWVTAYEFAAIPHDGRGARGFGSSGV